MFRLFFHGVAVDQEEILRENRGGDLPPGGNP
jgi:hypothetical protein